MSHEFLTYQVIIVIVALGLISRTFIQFLGNKKKFREFILAVIIWGAFAVLALFPNLSHFIARIFGFELGINFILTISTILIFGLIIHLILKSDKNEASITQIVRQVALKELEQTANSNKY